MIQIQVFADLRDAFGGLRLAEKGDEEGLDIGDVHGCITSWRRRIASWALPTHRRS
jgi:hypothetical protein